MFSNELICGILEYIDNNINKEITIDELSIIFFFNKTYIMKRFKKELGITIHEYINMMRVYNCLPLFKNDNYFLSIAIKNGFNSLEYFSETFKKIVGVNPTIYKKYLNYGTSVTKKQEDLIISNINHLIYTKQRVRNYLSHRKPKTTQVKKITL